ncbi:hypothetical protein ALC56_07724 [Trachymyrmex septentrionalis]|uniref:THAP domain-containing protein 9 n=1 Tax=Trachymyrmex septentrionalis TaxID=34720 RepID=A0A151JVQ3_9HYME|nr:hypothetical protein ALC56_07724 [Trachymyrmex septentrionalis]
MIALDEISITPGEQIDHGTMSHVGLSTLRDNNEIAHALVFLLGDIFTRWKIPVVYSIISDMDSMNLNMWKVFGGIVGGKHTKIKNNNRKKLLFIADAPHPLKSMRNMLVNNKVIELLMTFVQTHKLSNSIKPNDMIPTALQFQQCSKLLVLLQYLKSSYTSNYENDARHIIDFIGRPKKKECKTIAIDQCNNLPTIMQRFILLRMRISNERKKKVSK